MVTWNGNQQVYFFVLNKSVYGIVQIKCADKVEFRLEFFKTFQEVTSFLKEFFRQRNIMFAVHIHNMK